MALIFNTIQSRRGTAAEWTAANPVLSSGEPGFETDTGRVKIGDGSTHWVDLDYYPTVSTSEWIQQTPSGLTYLSATEFYCAGDQTSIFPVGIRVKAVVAAGTIYGSVTDVEAGGLPEITTVTVVWDSGQLDSDLSEIYTGIFSPVNSSIPVFNFVPIGGCLPYVGAVAPVGWELCYGQELSRVDYAALFAVCGTTFGSGDGSTTFNVPDLRGRNAVGPDDMGGDAAGRLTGVSLGDDGGTEDVDLAHVHATGDHTLTEAEMPAHYHTTPFARLAPAWPSIAANSLVNDGVTNTGSTGGGQAHNHGNTESSGSSTTSVMNPYCALNWIIRYI